jgi:hypothetical protein
MHVYEIRPRKDKRGVDLISDALPFGRLCYSAPPKAASNAIGYAKFFIRSHSVLPDDAIREKNLSGIVEKNSDDSGTSEVKGRIIYV